MFSLKEINDAIVRTSSDPKIKTFTPKYASSQQGPFIYPFREEDESRFSLILAREFTRETNPHTVYMAMTAPDEYAVWCGDSWCEPSDKVVVTAGKAVDTSAVSRAQQACDDAKTRLGLSLSAQDVLNDSYGKISAKSAPCNFWGAWKGRKVFCKHCQYTFLATGELQKSAEILTARWNDLVGSQATAPSTAQTTLEHPALAVLEQYAHRTPVFLDGPPGVGKTYVAALWAKRTERKLFVCGGDGGVEPSDLKGYLIPVPTGGSVYKPGTVTRAFLEAERGTPSLLLIDEVYQMSDTTFSTFFKVLTPFDGCYTLETDIIEGYDDDGIPICRVIRAPVDKLAIVLTANIGSNYGVQNRSAILAQRCRVEYVSISEPVMASILLHKAKEKGCFSQEEKIAKTLARFITTTIKLKRDGLLEEPCALRIADRVIQHASNDAEIADKLKAEALQCVDRDNDGAPVQEQVDTYVKAVQTVFAKF